MTCKMVHHALPWFLLAVCSSGCETQEATLQSVQKIVTRVQLSTKLHRPYISFGNVGTVLPEEGARCTFSFLNEEEEVLSLDPNLDIRKSCGCASLTVSPTMLAPGETAEISMNVTTLNKRDDFSETAVVRWKKDGQEWRSFAFNVKGNVKTAITLRPDNIFISSSASDHGSRRISVDSWLPVNWTTFVATPHCKGLNVRVEQHGNSPPSLLLPSPGTEESQYNFSFCRVNVSVERTDGKGRVSGEVIVHVETQTPLAISPSVIRLDLTDAPDEYEGELIVSGDCLSDAMNSLNGISGDGVVVKLVRVQELGKTARKVAFTLRGAREEIAKQNFHIHTTNGESVQFRCSLPHEKN